MSKPIHCIANCSTCGKEWQALNSQAVAKKHAEKYNHRVYGEIAYCFIYDFESKENNKK